MARDGTFICGGCRRSVPAEAAYCPACGFTFTAPSADPLPEPAHAAAGSRWLLRDLNGSRVVALVAAVVVATCVVTMMVTCYSRVLHPDSLLAIVLAFGWDMWPSVVAYALTGGARRPPFRQWVAAAAGTMAALWFYLLFDQVKRLSSNCMEQLGWMLALGPILCAGILIAGVLAGKLSDS